jgi:acetyl esterase/lipase
MVFDPQSILYIGVLWCLVHELLPSVLHLTIFSSWTLLLSVEYRLAPEHPDPAPVEDCYTGVKWVWENAAEVGIDVEKIVITGNSAGGGLAAGTSQVARD